MTMVRNRGSESTPSPTPPQRPLRSAAVVDRPRGKVIERGPTDANERQELRPMLDEGAGACDASGVPYGWRSGRGNALIDSAVQVPTGVEGRSRDSTRTPERRAATAANRGVRGDRVALSDRSPSFDAMTMVRDRGSEPTPTPPHPPHSLRSASTAVDRPRGEVLVKREPTDVNQRQELQPVSGMDAGACDTSGVPFRWRSGRDVAFVDSVVPASTGMGGSSRDCTRTPGRGVATATDRDSRDDRGAVSGQSPPFDVMAMVRNRGRDPTPPSPPLTSKKRRSTARYDDTLRSAFVVDHSQGEPARGSSAAASSTGPGLGGLGSCDTAGLQLNKNCYFCGRQSKRVRTQASALWVCGNKCGRW
ncbi:unnamed protein product, partial [Laminaria digitata]